MLRIGIVGLGFMGQNHFNMWQQVPEAQVVAVADRLPERVAEHAAPLGGNIGEARPLDFSALERCTSLGEMLASAELDCVDICTPTDLHADMTVQALDSGRHVICEKPMAPSAVDCDRMIAAARATGRQLFIAHCIRFWPAYEALAQMVADGELGNLQVARFTRLSAPPTWGSENWLLTPARGGGALLDLHIHDADFIQSVWGLPAGVTAFGAGGPSGGEPVDHVLTRYEYGDVVCVAEGGWAMPPDFPFQMAYWVMGERGVLEFSSARGEAPLFYPREGGCREISVDPGTGYERELQYFAKCMVRGREPERATPESSRDAVRLIMAEKESILSGSAVSLA